MVTTFEVFVSFFGRHPILGELSLRQWAGWVLIGLSCLGWVAVLVVPFLPLSLLVKGSLTAGLVVFGEIAWWGAMPLLGPEIVVLLRNGWLGIKNWFGRLFGRR